MRFTERINQTLNRIRRFKLREDRAILLICLGVALIFWILVKLSQEYTSQKVVSFSYQAPEDLALANIPPDDVQATLRGTGWNLMFEYLAHAAIPVQFNIEVAGEFRLNRAQLRGEILNALASQELEIVEINYDEIRLQVEPKVSKPVPVIPYLDLGFAAEHHLLSSPTLDPDTVTLTGAASVINVLNGWPTDSVRLVNLTHTVSAKVRLQAPPPEIHLSHQRTELTVPVEAYTEKSFFVPVTLKNAPADSVKVFPDKIKVSFVVGLSQYDSVRYTDFKLEVDLKASSLEKGKNTAPVNLTAQPASVKNVVLSRESIEFFILKPADAKGPGPG